MTILLKKFMEQRIQKLNKFELPGMEDSLPFPIEPLRTAPVKRPQKRASITSSDSGVTFPHALSAAMPITPKISHPYQVPPTSRTHPPTGPLTPIQQFINSSRKSKNKELKYNRSQLDYPDPQSVLRTRTPRYFKL